jgi:hypothetical protein
MKLMHPVLAMCLAMSFAMQLRAEQPEAKELAALLGKPIDSKEVKELSRKNVWSKITKFDEGSFTPRDYSYSLLYRQNKIATIVFQVAPRSKEYGEPHWTHYSRSLPGGLAQGDTREAVMKKLGNPTPGNPETDEGKNTWVAENLAIWVIFAEKGKIEELFVRSAPKAGK